MKRRIAIVIISISLLLLGGCASVPMATPDRDSGAKSFIAPSDKGGIYIFRNESIGSAIKMDLVLDGKPIGQTAAKTYAYILVDPGKHTIVGESENDSSIEVDAEQGKLYFVWQEVKMGVLYARNRLQLVDDATGRAGVSECHLIESAQR
jgi:hypothetical protein